MAGNYDNWRSRLPDTDICTDDVDCPCPACTEWRDNLEAEPDQLPTIREGYEQAVREREGLRR